MRSCSYLIYSYMVFLTLFYMWSEQLLEQFSILFSSFQTHWTFKTQYSKFIRTSCSLDSFVSYHISCTSVLSILKSCHSIFWSRIQLILLNIIGSNVYQFLDPSHTTLSCADFILRHLLKNEFFWQCVWCV